MKLVQNLVAAGTAALLLSPAAFAQSTVPAERSTVAADKQCSGLTGAALDSCLKSAPGRSGDAAARSDGRTPGSSEDAASRTGTPPASSGPGSTGSMGRTDTPPTGGAGMKK